MTPSPPLHPGPMALQVQKEPRHGAWGAAMGSSSQGQLREAEVQSLSEEPWKVLHTLSPRGIHPPHSAVSIDMTITTMGC